MENHGNGSLRAERILLIEDDADTRLIVNLYLNKSGFHDITETECGEEALEHIKDGAFDLVLLDWHMPGLQGIEVLREARFAKQEVPIIMLSAQGTEDRISEALDAGASSYVTKPFTKKGLIAKIDKLLTSNA